MNSNLEQYLKSLWLSVVFWSFALGCYAIFRFLGLQEEKGIIIAKEYTNLISLSNSITTFIIIGAILGILYASIEFLFDKIISRKLSLGLSLLLQNIIDFVVTVVIFTVTLSIMSKAFNVYVDTGIGWWLKDKTTWSLFFYILLSSFVLSFIKIAIERFGSGMFFKMLLGTYKIPKEEQRIFMFVDLKDSTAIAETLHHFTYSQFIQDCFYDLNSIIERYNAEVYQYVGDEVVLSWSFKKGLKNNNCITVFFAFQKQLQKRKTYYLEKYGIFPAFKAGVHGGKLIVAQVGTVKKELAYHGDVINTSARIQKACNKFQSNFLISESLLIQLPKKTDFKSLFLGEVLLKGKQETLKIHSLTLV